MEIRQVRYFVEFAATGSFSEAARRLFITQPAISRQVKLLEDELETPLLRREGNAVTLTPEGEIFYDEAKDLLEHFERVVRRVRTLRGETLRIGYVSSLVAALMPRALARFRTQSKGMRVELLDCTPAEACEAALRREVEVVIVPGGLEDRLRGWDLIEIWRQEAVLVMRRGHALAKRRRIDPGLLDGEGLLGLGRAAYPEYAPRLRAILKPFNVRPKLVSQTADGIPTLFADLVAVDGLAVLSAGIRDLLPPGLVARGFDPPMIGPSIFAGIPAARPGTQAQAFVKLLQEEGAMLG